MRVSFTDDGTNVFTFAIEFSEEFGISYVTLRDHAFSVTDGTVTKAQRLTHGSNIGWTITVTPDSGADVTVVLPVTKDCNSTGAVCTGDGRKLPNRLEFTVSGSDGWSGLRPGLAFRAAEQRAYPRRERPLPSPETAAARRRVPDHRLSQQRAKSCRNTLPQSKQNAIAKVGFGTYQSDEESLVLGKTHGMTHGIWGCRLTFGQRTSWDSTGANPDPRQRVRIRQRKTPRRTLLRPSCPARQALPGNLTSEVVDGLAPG